MTKIQRNQKPIDLDVHLKYKCPNPKCGLDNWISLREAQTKGFRMVCYCEQVFAPQRVKTVELIYREDKPIESPIPQPTPEPILVEEETLDCSVDVGEIESLLSVPEIPKEIFDRSSKILVALGYTKAESEAILRRGYFSEQLTDPHELVKFSLSLIGDINEQHNETFDI